MGRTIEYVRQADIDRVRWPELIVKLAAEQHGITRADVMELLHIDANRAYCQLSKLIKAGRLKVVGRGRWARYTGM
ncbi:type IV toxin-antitoxin system AbiEi family antitoxin domain-containing protein [Bifidobacterium stellenboschense]|uniref:type IV toxin-antitoxin system AbiEi family antitoxin domain-containing protein n=1 Tax=Bifidobacterium stellenboschense TaxID=762211 RepID=UPI000690FBCE|nr:type IV toxin-antitoxin system AbiEi family antitoxin domain-containing protein [Bifidobacterium stellenboschense]